MIGFFCELQSDWFSQCAPISPTTTTTTPQSLEGLDECVLPAETHLYSLITWGDATIHAHDVYTGIAIGGTLLDGSPQEHGNIAGLCSHCPSVVAGDCPTEACGSAPDHTDGTFHFEGLKLQVGVPIPFSWSDFEKLATTARSGVFPGSDGCDQFRVHVSTDGGEFAMSDFCPDLHGCNPEDNGCTLVIFNTNERVILNQGELGRQFGPSIIAPFSQVTLLDTAGYIDGVLVAKSFGGHVGTNAGSLQMHGDVYKGPIRCERSSTHTSSIPGLTTITTTMTTLTTVASAKTTTTTTTTMTASCTLWGDPHIIPFDSSKASRVVAHVFMSGDFWLVKNSVVHIQGRYWSDRRDGQSSTRAVAVGGPFLDKNRLVIEQQHDGKIYWNGHEILYKSPSSFTVPGLVKVSSRMQGDRVYSIDAELPLGVRLEVNRHAHHINVKIIIGRLPGGVDGHCGNFNGDARDDDTAHIKARFSTQVPGEELLFDKKEYAFEGCYADLFNNRDLPVRKGREHVDVVGCSVLCSGFKFFARQGRGQCWCGNSYGKHGSIMGCGCDSAAIGHSRNCVYRSLDAERDADNNRGIESCPLPRRKLGERKCKGAADAARRLRATSSRPQKIGKGKCIHGKIRWAGRLADVTACAAKCAMEQRCTHFTYYNKRGSCDLFSGRCKQRKKVRVGDTYKMPKAADPTTMTTSQRPSRVQTCEVKLYEHWAEDIKSWTGQIKTLSGTGVFPLGSFRGTSSVKVSGKGCVACGYTSADCSGAHGGCISWDQKVGKAPRGVVAPWHRLKKHWGCNDCARCVKVLQPEEPTPMAVPTKAQPTYDQELLHACVYDFCFGGPDMIEEDSIATNLLIDHS